VGKVSGDVVIIDVKLVARQQYQWAKIGRPPDLVFLEVIKDVPDSHVVGGEQQFALVGFPYGDSPIADDATEAVTLPTIKGSRDDGEISRTDIQIASKLRDKNFSVVEAAIPRSTKPRRDTYGCFSRRDSVVVWNGR
jgi:hypothetical protein